MWLHFIHHAEKTRRWGFELDGGNNSIQCIPAIGDTVWLAVGFPDNSSPETWLLARVTSREWDFDDVDGGQEVLMEVSIRNWIDERLEPHSEVWPLQEFTKRSEELQKLIKNSLRKKPSR